jgi:Ni,Fe-hydrogenase III large subunit
VGLAERISGDTTIGHSLSYCQALEALTGTEVPMRACFLRVILLEMEWRLPNDEVEDPESRLCTQVV